MLEIKNIVKDYTVGENAVHVLKGVSVAFRSCEFVAILGPSGCGKTTLLNIIGGLDRYTDGDIVVDGVSTRDYKDGDWDTYRNRRIGFVFQSYNLIPHLTAVKNVEMGLTIGGEGKEERRARALAALDKVGMRDYASAKPGRLSGGQMQRVAIARALAGDPDIILADEPTGALDSEAGVQVMRLLSEIARDRLVVMVTHNDALAAEYATRIIDLRDGVVTSDSAPYIHGEESRCPEETAAEAEFDEKSAETVQEDGKRAEPAPAGDENAGGQPTPPEDGKSDKTKRPRRRVKEGGHSGMSLGTAVSLSFTNLMSKKGRTLLTALAGCIGIIGIILVLALSGGAQAYIRGMEEDALSQYPITVERTGISLTSALEMLTDGGEEAEKYPDGEEVNVNKVLGNVLEHLTDGTLINTNDLVSFKAYLEENMSEIEKYGYVKYDYGTDFDVFCNYVGGSSYMKVDPFIEGIEDALGSSMPGLIEMAEQFGSLLSVWDEMIDNRTLLESQYDLLGDSRWPSSYDEVVIVLDETNSLNDYILFALGLVSASDIGEAINGGSGFADRTYSVDELLGLEYRLTTGSDYWQQDEEGNWYEVTERSDQREIDFVEGVNSEGEPNSVTVKVVGVVRPRQGTQVTSINGAIGYTSELTEYLSSRAENSPAVKALRVSYAESRTDLLGNAIESEEEFNELIVAMGVADLENPVAINLYASSFDGKAGIERFIADYNASVGEYSGQVIKYTDNLGMVMEFVDGMATTVTGVLVGFAAISLIVSSIMIAIIIYTSVLERRKEIGVLRALGARKRDIGNVFIAESAMIGFASGVMGVLFALIVFMPLNLLIEHFLSVGGLIVIEWWHAVMMIAISVVLAVLAGFIPSRIAAKKEPVTCLRDE